MDQSVVKLYLIRHGSAEDGPDDRNRPLSPEGVREAEIAGLFLAKMGANPGVIYHSPLVRAKQTAKKIARKLLVPARLTECAGILPEDEPADFVHTLDALDFKNEMAVVTHQPFISCLASYLLSGSECAVSMKFTPGTVAAFERLGQGGPWTLGFHLTSEAMSGQAINPNDD